MGLSSTNILVVGRGWILNKETDDDDDCNHDDNVKISMVTCSFGWSNDYDRKEGDNDQTVAYPY